MSFVDFTQPAELREVTVLAPSEVRLVHVEDQDRDVLLDSGGDRVVVVPDEQVEVSQVALAGPPGPRGLSGFGGREVLHVQAVPATSWVIQHGLGTEPTVLVIDTAGTVFPLYERVDPDVDTTDLGFSAPFSGRALLRA